MPLALGHHVPTTGDGASFLRCAYAAARTCSAFHASARLRLAPIAILAPLLQKRRRTASITNAIFHWRRLRSATADIFLMSCIDAMTASTSFDCFYSCPPGRSTPARRWLSTSPRCRIVRTPCDDRCAHTRRFEYYRVPLQACTVRPITAIDNYCRHM